jgi:transposase-like protein
MIEEILKHCRKGPTGRRLLTAEQKRLIVEIWEKSGLSGPEFCRRNDLILAILYKWRKDSIRGAKMGIQNQGELFGEAEYDSLRRENEELKKALGEAHLDIKILKKKLETDALRRVEKMSKNIPENLK